uniref:uncharacterized protein LOC122762738 isoform X1 n=1 Tax=Solea senegalensis TaxID=28829 RepID=UPI001CD8C166|nr:uncharacterized protein LOC122762738 isoform X1 [Solea senegalensis]
MLMLWLSCLLIGSVTCGPVKQAAPGSVPQETPYYWGGWMASGPSSMETAPEDTASDGPKGSTGQVAEDQSSSLGDDSAEEEQAESVVEDTVASEPEVVYLEPVFSDVSDLQPVYSFSSRSRYQRGKRVFSQTSYIPGPPAPVYRNSRPERQRSPPARAAPKKPGF